jgi:hypothetical protein
MELRNQPPSSHPLTAPAHPPERVTGPPELHHSKGRYQDHPFADGNKRIGTLLFLEFLRRNQLLLLADGQPRIADNGMAALALLIAESAPQQKELMIRLVMALLEDQL